MNNWISVKDRMPKDLQLCLCIVQGDRYDLRRYIVDDDLGEFDEVEFWQPLPQLPEDEG